MSLNAAQLLKEVIRPALVTINHWSAEAEILVLATAAQESNLRDLKQLPNGPALGLWQMEPETYVDCFANYLAFRPGIDLNVRSLASAVESGRRPCPNPKELVGNLPFAAAMCRVRYLRSPGELPKVGDVEGMARAWKDGYNTAGGAGTVDEFVRSYQRIVAPVIQEWRV